MLPLVAGATATTRQILIYCVLLLPISLLPCALGFGSLLFGTVAVSCGAIFVVLASQLHGSKGTDRRAAQRLFAFSIFYLFVLFAALLATTSAGHLRSRRALGRVPPHHYKAQRMTGLLDNARNSISRQADEN